MGAQNYDLKDILNIPLWEQVQDKLARYTGTAIITIDYKGTPITKHSMRTDFCSIIRENPVSRKRCYKCDALAGLEAIRLNRPFVYLCHCGIVDVAVPVTVNNRYLGAVMFGQVRLPASDSDKVERLVSEISSFEPNSQQARSDLLELYKKIPEMEYGKVEATAELIAAVVDYTVQHFLDSSAQNRTIDWILSNMESPSELSVSGVRSVAHIESVVEAEVNQLKSVSTGDELPGRKGSPIYPALVYVESHLGEAIMMQDMAKLCKVSGSYFSRLFYKDVGENFKD